MEGGQDWEKEKVNSWYVLQIDPAITPNSVIYMHILFFLLSHVRTISDLVIFFYVQLLLKRNQL